MVESSPDVSPRVRRARSPRAGKRQLPSLPTGPGQRPLSPQLPRDQRERAQAGATEIRGSDFKQQIKAERSKSVPPVVFKTVGEESVDTLAIRNGIPTPTVDAMKTFGPRVSKQMSLDTDSLSVKNPRAPRVGGHRRSFSVDDDEAKRLSLEDELSLQSHDLQTEDYLEEILSSPPDVMIGHKRSGSLRYHASWRPCWCHRLMNRSPMYLIDAVESIVLALKKNLDQEGYATFNKEDIYDDRFRPSNWRAPVAAAASRTELYICFVTREWCTDSDEQVSDVWNTMAEGLVFALFVSWSFIC